MYYFLIYPRRLPSSINISRLLDVPFLAFLEKSPYQMVPLSWKVVMRSKEPFKSKYIFCEVVQIISKYNLGMLIISPSNIMVVSPFQKFS